MTYAEARRHTDTLDEAIDLAVANDNYQASDLPGRLAGRDAYVSGIDATDRDSGPFKDGWLAAQADYERQTGNACNRSIRRSECIGYDESTRPWSY